MDVDERDSVRAEGGEMGRRERTGEQQLGRPQPARGGRGRAEGVPMAYDSTTRADHLLRRFYSGGHDADTALETPVASVRPAIRQRLSQKGIAGDDQEELCGLVVSRMIEAARRSQLPDGQLIGSFSGYALTVVESVFADHLRRTRPNWCGLKRRLLYLLDDHEGAGLFARWKHRLSWLGGFARWRGQPFRACARYSAFCDDDAEFRHGALADRTAAEVELPELLAHLFAWLGTPLEVDELTTHVARLREVHDLEPLSLDGLARESGRDLEYRQPASEEDVAAQVVAALSGAASRDRLWREIRVLLPRQRAALLLGMTRAELLLVAGTATSAAAALDVPLLEWASVWTDLPLADREIAGRLEVTPKQVSNLRKCARERLARWLTSSEAGNDGAVG